MTDVRAAIGESGEALAAGFLRRHGLTVVATNVVSADGEIDLCARDGNRKVVVEVRTITGPSEVLDAFPAVKATRVGALARSFGADRVDFVGVRLGPDAVEFRWAKGVA